MGLGSVLFSFVHPSSYFAVSIQSKKWIYVPWKRISWIYFLYQGFTFFLVKIHSIQLQFNFWLYFTIFVKIRGSGRLFFFLWFKPLELWSVVLTTSQVTVAHACKEISFVGGLQGLRRSIGKSKLGLIWFRSHVRDCIHTCWIYIFEAAFRNAQYMPL